MHDQAVRRNKGQKPKKPENSEIVVRGSTAMSVVFQLSSRVPNFIEQSHLEATEGKLTYPSPHLSILTNPLAWIAYWSPILKTLARQCLNPCRSIRQQAFVSLQRTLLSADLASSDHKEWTSIFGEVLIPLITQLLKPEVYQSDPLGMSETRVRAATLLSKVFLHYLVLLDGLGEKGEKGLFEELWITIVGIMDRLGNSGQGDMEEAVAENLKNMLLVLSSGGYLAPPDENPEREELWHKTWKRINRFQPNLFAELFPEEAGKPPRPRPSKDERAASKSPVPPVEGQEKDVPIRTKGGEETKDSEEDEDDKDDEKEEEEEAPKKKVEEKEN